MAGKKKAAKSIAKAAKRLTGDASKRARARALKRSRIGKVEKEDGYVTRFSDSARYSPEDNPMGLSGIVPAIEAKISGRKAIRKYLGLPSDFPVKGRVAAGGKGSKSQPPVLRGVSTKQLAEAHSITELNKMIKSVKSGRIGKGLSDKEKASQIKRLNKALNSKARTEKDVGQVMKEGQRQWNPKEGMVMKRGGLIGPSYRHGRKDLRKGGMVKRMK